MFHDFMRQAGGMNRFNHIRALAPLDQQTAVRMNKDTLYSFAVVDTAGGASITLPEITGRYVSAYLLDNDHYAADILHAPGTHALPQATRYLGVGIRIQVLNPDDPADIAAVNRLQDQFTIAAASAEPVPEPTWDKASLDALRERYEREFQRYDRYPADWQGRRGTLNEQTRQAACAGAWGLLPEAEAVYINYSGGEDAQTCHRATFTTPENQAFWSITVYGPDGYIKSRRSSVNTGNVTRNPDGTFTVHFGSAEQCRDRPNRVDVTEGWNYLMRVYRPGRAVIDGSYRLPRAEAVRP